MDRFRASEVLIPWILCFGSSCFASCCLVAGAGCVCDWKALAIAYAGTTTFLLASLQCDGLDPDWRDDAEP